MMNQKVQRVYPDAERLDAWEIPSNIRSKKIRKSDLNRFTTKDFSFRVPKRFSSPWEIFKFFIHYSGWHGVRYWTDKDLHYIERILSFLLDLLCLILSVYIISILYTDFQTKNTTVIIDNLQSNVHEFQFPGITVCPNSRIDNNKVSNAIEKHASLLDEETKMELEDLIRGMGNMTLTHFQQINSSLEMNKHYVLRDVNVTKILLDVLPSCEDIFSDCKWKHAKENCCNIFEIRTTYFGFCYGLNLNLPFNTSFYSSEPGSGIRFTQKPVDNGSNQAIIIIDEQSRYPTKGGTFTFGYKYDIGVQVSGIIASSEIKALSEYPNPPCKYDNGKYKYSNCLSDCVGRRLIEDIGCNPIFFFPYLDGVPECRINDFKKIENISVRINDAYDIFFGKDVINTAIPCECLKECESYSYTCFTRDVPINKREIEFDIHMYSRTGIRYKLDIIFSPLDMLVKIGGIFGLFMGGSIITCFETFYCLATLFSYYVWKIVHKLRGKDRIEKRKVMINVISHPKDLFPFTN